ncbi:Methylmalonyl-CoA mutase, partial [hydrothermal vent metagenome]
YQLVAEEQGVPASEIRGTVQNDILKEYIARGTYIFPVAPSMRLVTDVFAYCNTNLPAWNTISISGYHIREAGSTAAQELAFTIANGLAYVEAAIEAGLDVDEFASRLSFFWNSHNNLFEEVAKFRAARRMWAHLMRERIGAADPASWRMRFHTQTAGSTLTAQQPLVNIARTTVQALAGVLGGTQSLHTNAFDEALGLPTELSAMVALRTQQVLGYESGIADTVDPLAGSYFVESMTDAIEEKAHSLIAQIDERGGAVQAITEGFPQREIEDAAYATARAQDAGEQIVVGVNKFTVTDEEPIEILHVDPQIEIDQVSQLSTLRTGRDSNAVANALADLRTVAQSDANIMMPLKVALSASATVGEVSDVLRDVFGVYRPA